MCVYVCVLVKVCLCLCVGVRVRVWIIMCAGTRVCYRMWDIRINVYLCGYVLPVSRMYKSLYATSSAKLIPPYKNMYFPYAATAWPLLGVGVSPTWCQYKDIKLWLKLLLQSIDTNTAEKVFHILGISIEEKILQEFVLVIGAILLDHKLFFEKKSNEVYAVPFWSGRHHAWFLQS